MLRYLEPPTPTQMQCAITYDSFEKLHFTQTMIQGGENKITVEIALFAYLWVPPNEVLRGFSHLPSPIPRPFVYFWQVKKFALS